MDNDKVRELADKMAEVILDEIAGQIGVSREVMDDVIISLASYLTVKEEKEQNEDWSLDENMAGDIDLTDLFNN